MSVLARLAQLALVPVLVMTPSSVASAAVITEVVPDTEWIQWLRSEARSFKQSTATKALAVRLHADVPTPIDLWGVANPDGSLAVTFAAPGYRFQARCTDGRTCWVRQTEGGSDRLWHPVAANELAGLREALPELDGFRGDGVTCTLDGSTGRLDFDLEGTVVTAVVSFENGRFSLDERVDNPSEGVTATVTKTLTPARAVSVRPPRESALGPPMIRDVVPELP